MMAYWGPSLGTLYKYGLGFHFRWRVFIELWVFATCVLAQHFCMGTGICDLIQGSEGDPLMALGPEGAALSVYVQEGECLGSAGAHDLLPLCC